jgi:hypothetical protein
MAGQPTIGAVPVIDHLVYAVPDLETAIDSFERATGVRPAPGGAHDGMGTHNALVSLGDCYLELIARDPARPEPDQPRPFGIDDLDEARLVTYAVRPAATESLGTLIGAARSRGFDPGTAVAMSRTTPHHQTLHWHLTFPTDTGDGLVPFLIDWGSTPRPADTAPGGLALVDLVLAHPDPGRVVRALAALGLRQPAVGTSERPSLRASLRGPGGVLEL